MELDTVQRRLIKSKIAPCSMLKGAHGSGKTTAAIYRIIYLKNNYCLYDDDKIAIVSYTEENLNKIKNLYNTFNKESYMDYISLFSSQEHKICFFILNDIINKYFLEFKRQNNLEAEVIHDENKKVHIINKCIDSARQLYPQVKLLDHKYTDFLVDEIKWIKSCNYIDINLYQNVDRIGRKFKKGSGPRRLLKNSMEREAIFNIMLQYNGCLIKENLIDYEDKVLLALKQIQQRGTDRYTHIVVSESEKLSKVQLDFINALMSAQPYSGVLYIVNNEEKAGSNAWFIKGRGINRLDFPCKPKSYLFRKSYNAKEEIKSSVENFQYFDLRHRKSFDFTCDENNKSNIILSCENGGSELTEDELRELPVYNDIAAGEPILMNPEMEETFYIPKYWLKGMKDCFILRVKGDSMINADINDGDHVIIRKQSMAENNDIVAADMDGSATLKRLKIGKTSAALMPENEKYKPIPITDEGVRILGVAVGILKKEGASD